jgi:acetate kinase
MKAILAVNCGSSSLKCAVIDVDASARLLDVRIVDIGTLRCRILVNESNGRDCHCDDVAGATNLALEEIASSPWGANLVAVAHRIVHGGADFSGPVLLDAASVATIDRISALAPLHNVPALAAVRVTRRRLGSMPHVAVFDTAFHATLPRRAREYAISPDLAKRLGIQRYGFHGISHSHVMRGVAACLGAVAQDLRIISCHLGNGASVAAIEYGRSVETSMGMTPLEGLVMGSRCGDIDPGILLHLMREGGYELNTLERLLNSESGLKGLTGTQDMREIEARAAGGDEGCRLAIALYAHRVRKYVGAYAVVMGGVDVIAFTGGVGEASAVIRHRIAQRLDFLGAVLDEDLNRAAKVDARHPTAEISMGGSRTRLIVLHADEEMTIATAAASLLAEEAVARPVRVPIAISARHVHLSKHTLDSVFGKGYALRPRTWLSQHGQFAAEETLTLVGPRGRIEHVRVMGPPRARDQVEISRSDEFTLGLDAPVRISGDVANTPGITIEGPVGRVTLASGVICARRHIHMSPRDAAGLGLRDHDCVEVRIDSAGRQLTFADVIVRVAPDYQFEVHLDTDEANAAGVQPGDTGEIMVRARSTGSTPEGKRRPNRA